MLHYMKRHAAWAAFVAQLFFYTTPSQAVDVWRETVDGDISGDRTAPSSAALVMGRNELTATSMGPPATADREYITFSMPAGSLLTRIYVEAYTGLDEIGFIGVQAGTTFTEPPSGTNVANLLGYDHFGPALYPFGRNILPNMGMGPGSMGFTPPLPADDYTFWIQQTGASPATYTIGFMVVPEPGTLGLLAIGGLASFAGRRRRTCG
jgi:hypothetical protein